MVGEGGRSEAFIQLFFLFKSADSWMKSARLPEPREGGCAAPLYRSQRLGDQSTAAAPPHPFRGLPQTPGRSLRPAAPHNISRCKWPNPEARRENTSQSGAADSRFPPPFAPPLIGKATAPLSPLPNHPHLSPPTRGEVAHPLASSPGCSGIARCGGGVCHLVTLILTPSQTHPYSLSQSSCWCC